jgi:hypothetical protein
MANLNEKRTAPRITTVVPVNCRIVTEGKPVLPSQRSERTVGGTFSAKTVNVSRDGMLINCDSDLVPGAQIEIAFDSPADGKHVKITATVAWSRRNAMNLFGRYAAGLMVRKISEKDLSALADFFKPL